MTTTNLTTQGDAIAQLLTDIETHLDTSYRLASKLSVAACEFGEAAGLTLRAGQPVLDHLGRLNGLLAAARGETIGAHRHIERIARAAGYGDGEPKPDGFFVQAGHDTPVVSLAA